MGRPRGSGDPLGVKGALGGLDGLVECAKGSGGVLGA